MKQVARRVDQPHCFFRAEYNRQTSTVVPRIRKIFLHVAALQRLCIQKSNRGNMLHHRSNRELALFEQIRVITPQIIRPEAVEPLAAIAESHDYFLAFPALDALSRINDAVRRILRVKLRAGLFEHPYVDQAKAVDPNSFLTPPDRAARAYREPAATAPPSAPAPCAAAASSPLSSAPVRRGASFKSVLYKLGQPASRTGSSYRYCVRGGRHLSVVFNRRGRVARLRRS